MKAKYDHFKWRKENPRYQYMESLHRKFNCEMSRMLRRNPNLSFRRAYSLIAARASWKSILISLPQESWRRAYYRWMATKRSTCNLQPK